MKSLLLTALLLAAPAASAQTAPTTTGSTATTLRLTAPVGASVALTSAVQTRITLEDLRVTGPDGQPVSGAEIAAQRADLERSLGAVQATSVKTFYRVQGRAADGTVTLLTSVVTDVPRQGAVTVRVTQTVAPDGETQVTRVESDDPALQAAFRNLSPDVLRVRVQANAAGGNLTGLYGQTFTPGQARTQTATVDAQALLNGLFSSLASSMGAGQLPGTVRASPLTVTTTTTYRGTDAAGRLVFDTSSRAGDWAIELGDPNDRSAPLPLRLELLDLTQGGRSLYRPDGLPAGGTQTQNVRMRLSMTVPDGSRVQMVLRLNQAVQYR